ncbi:MAG: hypothetical protein ABJO09_16060 [Hyphomicrobiales bacterium]
MRHFQYLIAFLCIVSSCILAHSKMPETYQLKYWEGFVQYFETETYVVALTISDGFEVPDHTVSITAKLQDFKATIPLGLQGPHNPAIEGIVPVSFCGQDFLVVDFRWALNGEILVNSYERLFIEIQSRTLAASLDDVMSSRINGWFPAENIAVFYDITCGEEPKFTPKPHTVFDGGGVILTDRPGH